MLRLRKSRDDTSLMETFKRWEPVQGVEWPCGGAAISTDPDGLSVRLEFSAVIGGGGRDLLLRLPWGYMVGFASWQEFAHPWNNEAVLDKLPKLVGQWVRIVTLDHTVEILATAEPDAEWVS